MKSRDELSRVGWSAMSRVAANEARGQLGKPEERERPTLEAVTRRLVKSVTEDTNGAYNIDL